MARRDKKVPVMDNVSKFKRVFTNELRQIDNDEVKEFILLCVKLSCQDYFFEKPASFTGKYHPRLSLGLGGIIRHTKYAFWWANELIKTQHCLIDIKADVIRGAILIHDMMKRGYNYNDAPPKINNTHGQMLVLDIVCKLPKDYVLKDCHIAILDAVGKHMGEWSDPRPQTMTGITTIVHLADYIASRKVEPVLEMLTEEANEASITNSKIPESCAKTEEPDCDSCHLMNCPVNPHRHDV